MALVGDPAWRVEADGGHLVVTAGADAVWVVEDVPPSVADVVARYWSAAPPDMADLPAPARPVVERLAGLGALRPAALRVASPGVRLVVVGDPLPAFADELGTDDDGGLVVVLRTNAPLAALIDTAASLHRTGTAHVLCDVAFHHTIVLGPHVVPGDTACMACLAGRVGVRWGDPPPPVAPMAMSDAALAARLICRWVANVTAGSAALVNATVAFDLASLSTRRAPLWRSPLCPVCEPWPGDGSVALPWAEVQS